MKNMKNILILALSVVFLSSCEKEEATAPQPINNTTGAKIQSYIVQNKTFVFNSNKRTHELMIDVDAITDDVITAGDVSAYITKSGLSTKWTALPGNYDNEIPNTTPIFFDYYYVKGKLCVYSLLSPSFGYVDIKIVITKP